MVSRASFSDEPGAPSDWSRVGELQRGQTVWVATRNVALTEYVMAGVTNGEIGLALVSGHRASSASKEEVAEFCAGSPERRLVVDGQLRAFSRLCRLVHRSDVRQICVRKRSSPLRAVLIGALVGGGAMLLPCQVAPQGGGSVAGCTVSSVGVGALVGWGAHGVRKGKLVKIYTVEENDEPFHRVGARLYELPHPRGSSDACRPLGTNLRRVAPGLPSRSERVLDSGGCADGYLFGDFRDRAPDRSDGSRLWNRY